ncbi:MAG TPA: hypothetical protein VI756_23970 [Blastocatellia bacterium]
MMTNRTVASLIVALLMAGPLMAQTREPQTPAAQQQSSAQSSDNSQATDQQKQDQRATTEKAGLDLLNQVIVEIGGLKLAENRVRLQMLAAHILWKRDQPRARLLFKQAADSLAELIHSMEPSDAQYGSQYAIAVQLRQDLAMMAATLDARMALDFLNTTTLPSSGGPFRGDDGETSLKIQMAAQMAATDPKDALQIAEGLRKTGPAPELVGLLRQFQPADINAAQTLAGDLAGDLQSQDLTQNPQMANAAITLLSMALSPSSQGQQVEGQPQPDQASASPASAPANQTQPLLDAKTTKSLLAQVVAAANPAGQSGVTNQPIVVLNGVAADNGSAIMTQRNVFTSFYLAAQLRAMLPAIQQYDPQQGAALAQKLGPPANEVSSPLNVPDNASVDDIVAMASKADPRFQQALTMQAINKAITDGDFDRARQIAGNISDPVNRQQTLDQVDGQAASKASEEDKLESAWKTAVRIRTKDTRLAALVQLATTAVDKSEAKLALQILDDAQSQMSGHAENYNQLNLAFSIAALLSKLNPERTVEVFHGPCDQLNSLIAAASVLNGFDVQAFRDGELELSGSGGQFANTLETFGFELAAIAKKDPAVAVEATSGLQAPEAAMLVRFSIARSLLAPEGAPPMSEDTDDK